MSLYTIMKCIELDAGHRVPFHNSKCRNLHGHRYKIEVELYSTAVVPDQMQDSESGMVMDFGIVKQILQTTIHDRYDHGLILWDQDPLILDTEFHKIMTDHGQKIVLIPVIPTAEQLAYHWGNEFYRAWKSELKGHHLALSPAMKRFRVWETPNSYSDFS